MINFNELVRSSSYGFRQSPPFSYAAALAAIGPSQEPVLWGIDLDGKDRNDCTQGTSKSSGERTFLKGSRNEFKLKAALEQTGNLSVFQGNLLRESVGRNHGEEMAERLHRKAKRVEKREAAKLAKLAKKGDRPYRRGERRIKLFSEYQSFKFITILYEVVELDDEAVMNSVKKFNSHLREAFGCVKGVSCLGAFENEVTSVNILRNICDRKQVAKREAMSDNEDDNARLKEMNQLTEDEEFRKLTTLEAMSRDLKRSLYQNEPSEILVHFHGVVYAESEGKFDELLEVLKQNPKLNKFPRQIDFTSLTKKYGNKEKTVEQNLTDIAAYITKGGNDWIGKRPYLRYKVTFSNGLPMTDDEIRNQNWRSSEVLRDGSKDQEGVIDLLSLSVKEITVLALATEKIMKLSPKGKGYQFVHGRF